jgi:hypothetical protein
MGGVNFKIACEQNPILANPEGNKTSRASELFQNWNWGSILECLKPNSTAK